MNFKENTLYVADCLELLKYWYHKERISNVIDLIYIDPPFNSKRDYNIIIQPHDIQLQEEAFADTWSLVNYSDSLEEIKDMGYINLYLFLEGLKNSNLLESYIAYLTHMAIRLIYMKEMLKDTGSFYYHCDPTMSHYIKVILDYVFGVSNYINEIIWPRTRNTGSSKAIANAYPKNHDIIFIYSKTKNYEFNQQIRKFDKEEIKWRFPHDDKDGKGPYHWNTLASYSKERLDLLRRNDELKESTKDSVKHKYSYKVYYLQHRGGIVISDIWDDINPVHGSSKEFQPYPTQKPEKLLERIILSSSNEDELVADFFMGGGTTPTVCKKNNRNFIGADINLRAIQWSSNRLSKIKVGNVHYISGIPSSSKQLKAYLTNFNPSIGGYTLEDLVIKIYLSRTIKVHNFEVIGQKKNNPAYDGEFIFKFQDKTRRGIVQVTSSHNYSHFRSFCHSIQSEADIGVYITFENTITNRMKVIASNSKKIGDVKSIQILTIEDLLDNKILFDIPKDLLTV